MACDVGVLPPCPPYLKQKEDSMVHGTKGMGSHKHGISGFAPSSPRQRMAMKLFAERNSEKKRKNVKMFSNIRELFNSK